MSVIRAVCLSALLTGCGLDGTLGFRNAEPSANIASPSVDQTLFQGVSQRFRGVAQDLDDSYDELTVTWTANDEQLCPPMSPNEIGDAFCDIALPAGPTEITFVVSDGASRAEDVKIFWARPSEPPTAEIISLDPTGQYYADFPIDFEGEVHDTEDDDATLTVWWESNIDGVLGSVSALPGDDGSVVGSGFLTEGDHLIRLVVEDSAGNQSFDTTVIRVGPSNRPPDCLGIDNPLDGGVVEAGELVLFSAQVTDPDVAANFLSVEWRSDKDGVLGTSGPTSGGQVTFPYNGLSNDTHLISLTATDPFGLTCTATILLTVDSPPTIQVNTPLPNAVYAASTPIEFTATVGDNEDAAASLDIEWVDDFQGNQRTLWDTNAAPDGTTSFTRSDLQAGQHTITLTATDNSGLSTQAQVTYRVNGLPGPADVIITPGTPATADAFTAQLDSPSIDPDGDNVSYTYAWYRNDVLRAALTGPSVPASETTKGQTWRVEVTPSDPYGTGPTATASVVIRNTAPVLDDVSIQGGPFFESSTVTCAPGLGTDADGDTVSFVYGWTLNGNAQPFTTQTLTGDQFNRDDVVQCTATPTDGATQGLSVSSGSVTILNTPPQVSDVVVTPTAPEATDTVQCQWNFTDADSDTPQSTVAWKINNVPVSDTGATLTSSVTAGDVVTCTVTANDGDAAGNSLSSSATIVRSAPTIDSVDVRPNVANAATPLTCAYTGFTDPQGDADESRYAWTVNGTPASTGSSLSTGYGKGDVVVCTVTPSDGSFDGTPLSDSVTIQNSPPTGPVVEIDPEFPLAGLDDLVCGLRTRATDPDGDPVSYTFSWTVEGSPFFGAIDDAETSTVSASEFGGLETWECTATPTDGEDTGPSGSASVFTLPSIDPKVATGSVHSCKLDRRGEVACWGLNQLGRLTVPGDLFLDIDAGFEYTCGITQDSTLRCWGVDTAPGEKFFPPNGEFTSIGAGIRFACATATDAGITCWGDSNDPDGVVTGAAALSGRFTDVVVGERHACAVRESGQLLCWGNNGQNQVSGNSTLPRPSSVVSIAAGYLHNCAVLTDGSIQCWGNDFGGRSTPTPGNDYVAVAAGVVHSCGIRADGTATCWGFDTGGRATPPTTDSDGNPIVFVSADVTNHSCGIESDGRAFCWGPDNEGQASPPQ